jgi:hypothetical protein
MKYYSYYCTNISNCKIRRTIYFEKEMYLVGYIHESSFVMFSIRDAINYLSSFNARIILFS